METDPDGRVLRFLEKPKPHEITTDTINAGIYVLETRVLELIPPGVNHSIERGFFPALLARGDLVLGPVHRGYWIDIGTPEKYLQVHRDILHGRFRVALEAEPVRGGFVAKGARVAPEAELQPPFFVGPGCEVEAGARVGPDAVLVRDVRVRAGALVRDSVLWTGAEAGARRGRRDEPARPRRAASARTRWCAGRCSARAASCPTTRRPPGRARGEGDRARHLQGLRHPGPLPRASSTPRSFRRIGSALVDYLGARRIAVGRDCRLSSPELAAGFVAGARSRGAAVTDIGVVSTDMLYYYVARNDLEGGAIVTASHNPKEWNGVKMVRRGALALSGDAGHPRDPRVARRPAATPSRGAHGRARRRRR